MKYGSCSHEIAHHSRQHLWKGTLWYALLLLPLLAAVAWFTRRRGGLYEPRAVPLALFALVVGGLALQPLGNAVSREQEAEADWIALETTRDPRRRALFQGFTEEALEAGPTGLGAPGVLDIHPWSSALRWRPPGTRSAAARN